MHPALALFVKRAILARRTGTVQGIYSAKTALGMLACFVDCDGRQDRAKFTLDGKPIRSNILNSALAKCDPIK